MGFLKRFFNSVLHDTSGPEANNGNSSFAQLTSAQLEAHLEVSRYGNFQLTDAIRPSYNLQVTPEIGYRHDSYKDDQMGKSVPVLMAAASREHLFELFMESLQPLGSVVDVVIETSHNEQSGGHQDLYRECIDMPVLESVLWDFEDMLLNDGCTGIAVLNPAVPQEVQFDEHKLLIVYGEPLGKFEKVLQKRRIPRRENMRFITEAEHVHSSNEEFAQQFDELKMRLGMDGLFG